ncbi:hypothetical protein FRB90_008743, partial [Tulasnella sp. 427]
MDSDNVPDDRELSFDGKDGSAAESFVIAVQRKARVEGKSRDNEWIIDLVSTCLTGAALRWYVDLDDDTQNDWKLLRRAILQRYPPAPTEVGRSAFTSPSTVPTPAAAASPPNPISSPQPAPSVTVQAYHIRAYYNDFATPYRVAAKEDQVMYLTMNIGRALTVGWDKGCLCKVESGHITHHKIGLIWNFSPRYLRSPREETDSAAFFLSDPQRTNPPLLNPHKGLEMLSWDISTSGWLLPVYDYEIFQDTVFLAEPTRIQDDKRIM